MVLLATNATRVESGVQWSALVTLRVLTGLMLVSARSATHARVLAFASQAEKASLVPSGDHTRLVGARAAPVSTRCPPVPSRFMRYMWTGVPPVWSSQTV